MCSTPYLKAILADRTKDGAVNCFEFWFNRYQTLLGAVLALIAAWIATIPARKQLREMSRQSAASARQSMVELASALETEAEIIQLVSIAEAHAYAVVDTYREEDFQDIYQTWPNNCWDSRRELRSLMRRLSIIANRYGEDDIIFTSRNKLIKQIGIVTDKMRRLHLAFRLQTTGIDPEYDTEEMSEQQMNFAGRDADAALSQLRFLCSFAKDELQVSIRSVWVEIRALEARTINT